MSERQVYEGNAASDHARQHNGNEYHNNQWYSLFVSPDYALPAVGTQSKRRKPYPTPPHVSCSKCTAKDIATELHYHCSQCDGGAFNLCLRCYRDEKGCYHSPRRPKGVYVGEGELRWRSYSYRPKWMVPHQQNGALPHILHARKYLPSIDEKSFKELEGEHDIEAIWELHEGAFCDNCFKYCEDTSHDQYWNCRLCFGGAWGFCSSCVRQGQHCTHALYPLQHTRYLNSSEIPPTAYFKAPHLPSLEYVHDAVNNVCDECGDSLSPEAERYHCYKCLDGDFDMCQSCFDSMYQKKNMPPGWREMHRCINGHETAIVDYRTVPFGSPLSGIYEAHVRFTVEGPRSGWRRDGTSDFLRCSAIHNWFPPKNGDDPDCLYFPRGAGIEEVTEVEEGWMIGVYCGQQGRFPARYVRPQDTKLIATPVTES